MVNTVCALRNILKHLRSKQAPLLQRLRLNPSPVIALDIAHQRVVPLRRRLLRLLGEEPNREPFYGLQRLPVNGLARGVERISKRRQDTYSNQELTQGGGGGSHL